MTVDDKNVKREIVEAAKDQHTRYRAMTRKKLLEEYEGKTGIRPHPRTNKEWLVTALSRWFQTRLYADRLGYVPGKVAEKNIEFFLSNQVFLISKDRERAQKRREKKRIVIQELPQIKKVPKEIDIRDKHLRPIVEENPYSEYPLSDFFELLLAQKVMSFDKLTKWCNSQEQRVLPIYVFNTVVSDGNAEWMIKDEEGVYYVWSEMSHKDIGLTDETSEANDVNELIRDFSIDRNLSSRIGQEKSSEIVGDMAPNKNARQSVGKVVRKDRDLVKIRPDFNEEFDEFGDEDLKAVLTTDEDDC